MSETKRESLSDPVTDGSFSNAFGSVLGKWNMLEKKRENSASALPFIERIASKREIMNDSSSSLKDANSPDSAKVPLDVEKKKAAKDEKKKTKKKRRSTVSDAIRRSLSFVMSKSSDDETDLGSGKEESNVNGSGGKKKKSKKKASKRESKITPTIKKFDEQDRQNKLKKESSKKKQSKTKGSSRKLKRDGSTRKSLDALSVLVRKDSSSRTPEKLGKVSAPSLDGSSSHFDGPDYTIDDEDAIVIQVAVESSFVFEGMNDETMNAFINSFAPVEYSKGEVIFKEGEKAEYCYVVINGRVSFDIDGSYTIRTATDGDSFGELAMFYSCPQEATAIADEPTKLYRVHKKVCRQLLRAQTNKSKKDKQELLKNLSFLKDLDEEIDIKSICDAMKLVVFEVGDALFQKGDNGDRFYIVQHGQVRMTERKVGSCEYLPVTMGPGDHFGELSLLAGAPRECSALAIVRGSGFSIDKDVFMEHFGHLENKLNKAQDKGLLAGINFFKQARLEVEKIEELVDEIINKSYAGNTTIFGEGSLVEAGLYLVREGTVQLTSKDGTYVEQIEAGGFFGEEQLMADVKNNTTSDSTNVKAGYTATTGSAKGASVSVLTLEDCRRTFDTKDIDMTFLDTKSRLLRERKTMEAAVQENLKLDDFKRHKVLGEGQFGEVWLVSADLPGKKESNEFALKIQHKVDSLREDALQTIKRELTIIQQLNHPFIINLFNHYEDDDHVYMIMNLVKGCELWDVIHQEMPDGTWRSGLIERHAKFYSLIIADVLIYMHREGFIFRDLKPENILIDRTGYPILVDFGFAKYCADKTYTFCGTPNYVAPEIVTSVGHGAQADYWALGCMIHEMVKGENPFYYEGMDQMELFNAICTEKPDELPDDYSSDVKDLISKLLTKDPAKRCGETPATRENFILTHPWFDTFDLEKVRNMEIEAPWMPPEEFYEHP